MFIWPKNEELKKDITTIYGVGPKRGEVLIKAGFTQVGDLLGLNPALYQDRREIKSIKDLLADEENLTKGVITSIEEPYSSKTKRRYLRVIIEEPDFHLSLLWFNYPSYLRRSFKKGQELVVFGRAKIKKNKREMIHPLLENQKDFKPEVRAIYPQIGSLKAGVVRRIVAQAVESLATEKNILPREWLEENKLLDPWEALKTIHSPPSKSKGNIPKVRESIAFKQLIIFELVLTRLIALSRRLDTSTLIRKKALAGQELANDFWKHLPFEASLEQKRVYKEIENDLQLKTPMGRLLQGEVGGGKTVLALAAAFNALGQGRQVAILAPTEILANQHFALIKPIADKLSISTSFLSGSLNSVEKKQVKADLEEGKTALVVGTQALLSLDVKFHDLGLAVIDEQHRFGVKQRLVLRTANEKVDLLALSATPIPRSLSLSLYGDLDLSSLKGRLPGKKASQTFLYNHTQRDFVYQKLEEAVLNGAQAFVVAPRIDELSIEPKASSEESSVEIATVTEIYKYLQKKLSKKCNLALIHGKLNYKEQKNIMSDFHQGTTKVLVSTTLIEVGIDVPKATVMVIEGAEYFGLAQLHQLRGRVGRGKERGTCYLIAGENRSDFAWERLEVLLSTDDGYQLAEEDLKRRGPGEVFGLKQSGWPRLDYARLPDDLYLMPLVNELAEKLWFLKENKEFNSFFKHFKDLVTNLAHQTIKVD